MDLGYTTVVRAASSPPLTRETGWAHENHDRVNRPPRNSAFKTLDHDLHKQRRKQLSSFFSKASVCRFEPLIAKKVNRLCSRLEAKSTASRHGVISLSDAIVALTADLVTKLCFGQAYDLLELDDFAKNWYENRITLSHATHLLRQFPWLFYLPTSWLSTTKAAGESIVAVQQRIRDLTQQVSALAAEHAAAQSEKPAARHHDDDDSDASFPTVFHAILDADVPFSEKSASRLTEEAQALTGAGSLTSANALISIFYYILRQPGECLERLGQELRAAIPSESDLLTTSVGDLKKLPYLTAVIYEGLRLSKGVPHRFARVSRDEDFLYHSPTGEDIVIPHGVPVGMSFIDILENEEIFPEPDAFLPERWLSGPSGWNYANSEGDLVGGSNQDDAVLCRRKWALMTVFGGGTRMCLGLNLAWAEMYLTVATVLRRFGNSMRLYEVDFERDVKIVRDGFDGMPSPESKGLRVVIMPAPPVLV